MLDDPFSRNESGFAMSIHLERPRRGRPKGSGKNDSLAVRKVAELLLDDEEMSDWAAITTVVGQMDVDTFQRENIERASLVRRLHNKWRVQKRDLLADAAVDRQRRRVEQFKQGVGTLFAGMAMLAERMAPTLKVLGALAVTFNDRYGPAIRAADQNFRAVLDGPQARATLALVASARNELRMLERAALNHPVVTN
jgi:hypothetical protein